MKKNKVMRLASSLLVAALLTTSAVSGTFAKYVTSTNGTDTARVAYWGFKANESSIVLTDLFVDQYDSTSSATVDSEDGKDVMAPGTTHSASFSFAYEGYSDDVTAPEVAYNFTVSTEGSDCDSSIKDNESILWQLDNGAWGTWDQLMTSIKSLSGDANGTKSYGANTLPTAFYGEEKEGNKTHTISWKWIYANDGGTTSLAGCDKADTAMGNAEDLADVTLKITVTATQID